MSKPLSRLLRQEQLAFLARDKQAWGEHLNRVRAFLGEALQAADPRRPVLVLGAGSGLEVPWALAPPDATGWDADPWSRVWTALRHQRWPRWVFEDLTGGLAELAATAHRCSVEPWSGRRRDRAVAVQRLVGLLPSLHPEPAPLRAWILKHRPGTILVANVMGQFGVVAERVVEAALSGVPWELDPECRDPLADAIEAWTWRANQAFLGVLRDSRADLWMVHDRAVVFQAGHLELGPWTGDWRLQLRSEGPPVEASDALAGVDVLAAMEGTGFDLVRNERWIWPVAPDQSHLMEALAYRPKT